MARYSDTVEDQYANPVAGAQVSVYPRATPDVLAALTNDAGAAILNPVATDLDGLFSFNAPSGDYILSFKLASATRPFHSKTISLSDTIRTDLAASTGSSLIGYGTGGGTVEDVLPLAPESYGAEGDGITNDSVAFAAAIAAAMLTGRTLELDGSKTYLLSSWTLLTTTGTLRIRGNGARVKGPASRTGFAKPLHTFDIEGVRFERWETVLYNAATEAAAQVAGDVSGFRFVDNEATDLTSHVIGISCIAHRFTIEENYVHDNVGNYQFLIGNNRNADQDDWTGGSFSSNTVENCTASVPGSSIAAILIYGKDHRIKDNRINNITHTAATQPNPGEGSEAWGIYTKTRYSIISDNRIYNILSRFECVGLNIKGVGRASTASVNGYCNEISGNIVRRIGEVAYPGVGFGIRLQSDDLGCSDNYMEDFTGAGIYVHDSNGISNIDVTGNTIRQVSVAGGDYTALAASCIAIATFGSNYMIKGNICTTAAGSGVFVDPSYEIANVAQACTITRLHIEDNIFDVGTNGVTLALGTTPLQTVDQIKIRGNKVKPGAARGVLHNNATLATNVEISGNDFAGMVTAALALGGADASAYRIIDNIGLLENTNTWDPPSLATSTQQTRAVTVSGCLVGDLVDVTFSNPLQGTRLWATVETAGTVTVYHRNDTGGAIDLASGTLRVRCIRR